MRQLQETEIRLVKASEIERARKQRARRRTRALGIGALLTIAVIGLLAWFAWQTAETNNRLRVLEAQEKTRQQARNLKDLMEASMREGITARDLHREDFHAIHQFVHTDQLYLDASQEVLDTGLVEPRIADNSLLAASLLLGNTRLAQAYDLNITRKQINSMLPLLFVEISEDQSRMVVWSDSPSNGGIQDHFQVFDVPTGKPLTEQITVPVIHQVDLAPQGDRVLVTTERGELSIYRISATDGAQREHHEKAMVARTVLGPGPNEMIRWDSDKARLFRGDKVVKTVEFPFAGTENDLQIMVDVDQQANLIGSIDEKRYAVIFDVFGDNKVQEVGKRHNLSSPDSKEP